MDRVTNLDEAIARVEQLAEAQGQKLIQRGPVFEWRPQQPMDDGPEDDNNNSNDDLIIDENEGARGTMEEQVAVNVDNAEVGKDDAVALNNHDSNDEVEDMDDDDSKEVHEVSLNASNEDKEILEEPDVQEADQVWEEQGADEEAVVDEAVPAPAMDGGLYSLGQSRNRNYEHLFPDHEINLCAVGCQKLSTNI